MYKTFSFQRCLIFSFLNTNPVNEFVSGLSVYRKYTLVAYLNVSWYFKYVCKGLKRMRGIKEVKKIKYHAKYYEITFEPHQSGNNYMYFIEFY